MGECMQEYVCSSEKKRFDKPVFDQSNMQFRLDLFFSTLALHTVCFPQIQLKGLPPLASKTSRNEKVVESV